MDNKLGVVRWQMESGEGLRIDGTGLRIDSSERKGVFRASNQDHWSGPKLALVLTVPE